MIGRLLEKKCHSYEPTYRCLKSPVKGDLSFIRGGGGGGVGKQVQFFSQGNFSYAFPQFPAEKTVTLPLVWPKKVMTFLMLKDMTGIIKRDQLLPCAVHNRKRVGLLTDLLGVVTREEFS